MIGNVGQDPEIKKFDSGDSLCNFSVATNESWKDKNGEPQERTEWHRITAFGRLGEICGEYLRKGSKIYLEGKLQTRSWEEEGGTKRYATEIVAREMQMLDSRGGEDSGSSSGFGDSPASPNPVAPQPDKVDPDELPF